MSSQARLDTLAEIAAFVAKNNDAKASATYSIARDIWSIWWKEKQELLEKKE